MPISLFPDNSSSIETSLPYNRNDKRNIRVSFVVKNVSLQVVNNIKRRINGSLMRAQNFHEEHQRANRTLLGNMSWKTVYIVGKTDFREEISRKLEQSNQRYMPGYIDSSSDETTHDLYWLDGRTNLREFKEAISGKLIWKHRLLFFETLEEFLQSQQPKNELSPREKQMIAEMRRA